MAIPPILPSEPAGAEGWFDAPPPPPSAPVSLPPPPPRPPPGDPFSSTMIGAVSGAIGGAAMVFVAAHVARRWGFDVAIARMATAAFPFVRFDAAPPLVLIVACAAGALVGAAFGRLTRRLVRVAPRLAFGAILAPAIWTLVHAFALARFLPHLAASLPFGPMAAGAVAYGMCVGLVPPRRARRSR